ncbi:MAG: hemerythrin family protein [Proteobacteria bacterium]|nr:hemerythrin family protein [Pseudomonadota bacterium]
MFLNWTEDIAVGVGVIDEQHKKLFEHLNSFVEAVDSDAGSGEIDRVVGFLDTYVVEHFDTEELMMKEVSCPGMEEHIGQHRIFIDSLQEVKRTLARDGATDDIALMLRSNLCNWLFSHILMLDRRMGLFIKN